MATKREIEAILKLRDELSGKLKHANTVLNKFDKGVRSSSKQLQTLGSNMSRVGSSLLPMSLALGAVGIAALKFSTDLNEGMANVATLIPGNTARIQELRGVVQDLAIAHGKPQQDLVAGLYQTISAFGDQAADTVKILEINSRAAVAGVATTQDAINLTSAVTKAYGDTTAAAVQKVSDLAFQTVKLGQTTFPELAAAIGNVAPVAAQLNVSQEELAAGFATLTGVTGNTSIVSSQLAAVLRAMIKPTKDMQKAMKTLGFESAATMVQQLGMVGALEKLIGTTDGSEKAIGKLFGRVEGMNAVFALTGSQADTFKEKMAAMSDVAGISTEAFREQTEGINKAGFAWKQFKQEMVKAAQDLGDVLIPIVMRAVEQMHPLFDALKGLIKAFGDLPQPVQTFAVALGAIGTVAAPVLFILGQLIFAFSLIGPAAIKAAAGIKTFTVAVFGLPAAIIAAVGALKILDERAKENNEIFRQGLDPISSTILKLTDLAIAAVGARGALDTIPEPVRAGTGAFTEFEGAALSTKEALDLLSKPLPPLATNVQELTKAQQGLLDAFQTDTIVAAQQQLNDLAVLFETGKISAAEFSEQGIQKLVNQINALTAAGGIAAPVLNDLVDSFVPLTQAFNDQALATAGAIEGLFEEIDAIAELNAEIDAAIAQTEKYGFATDEAAATLNNLGITADEIFPELVEGAGQSLDAMAGFNDILSEARGLMTLLGIEADTVFGKIIGWLTKVFDAFNALTGIINKVLGLFGSKGLGGIGDIFGSLFGGGMEIPGITAGIGDLGLTAAGTTAGKGFLGGFGATVGKGLSSLGSALAPLFTNPFTIAIGAGIAGFFAIKGLFGGGANIAETVRREFGVGLSEGMQKALEDVAAQRGGDLSSTAQLMIGQIFRDALSRGEIIPTDVLAEEIGDIFAFLGRGDISMPEAITALEDAVPLLIERFSELGPEGQAQIERIIHAAQNMGVEFEGLDTLIGLFKGDLVEVGGIIQSAFAPSTIQELRAEFGLTREEVNALAEATGVKIQTNIQRMAAAAGLTTKEFKELRDVAAQHGIEVKDIAGLAAALGITVGELAEAWGVGVKGATDSTSEAFPAMDDNVKSAAGWAKELAIQLGNAAQAASKIQIPSGPPAAGFQHGTPPGGVIIRQPSLIPIAEAGPERLFVQPLRGGNAGGDVGGGGGDISFSLNITGGTFSGTPEENATAIIDEFLVRLRNNRGGLRTEIVEATRRG